MVIDSSALVAILRLEPDQPVLDDKLSRAPLRLISAMTLFEAGVVIGSRRLENENLADLDALVARFQIEIVPFDADQQGAARAAYLRFGKGRHPAGLNICDCAAYALARTRNLPLLFKGNDFAKTDVLVA